MVKHESWCDFPTHDHEACRTLLGQMTISGHEVEVRLVRADAGPAVHLHVMTHVCQHTLKLTDERLIELETLLRMARTMISP